MVLVVVLIVLWPPVLASLAASLRIERRNRAEIREIQGRLAEDQRRREEALRALTDDEPIYGPQRRRRHLSAVK
jgi:hypothetical protein